MLTKSSDVSRQLAIPLSLITLGYVASHLPVLFASRVAPLHIIQVVALAWVLGALVVSESLRKLLRQLITRYQLLLLGFVALLVWSGASLFWGAHTVTSTYKVVLLGAGVAFAATTLFFLNATRLSRDKVERLLIYAGVALAIFCIWQFVGDNLGAPHWMVQIVPGGHWDQIDFSRVNGLSEEPQFLTTILLLPASLLYLAITTRARRWHWLALLTIDTAIFLALSRGGFLAYGFLATVWLGYWLAKRRWQFVWRRVAVGSAALLLTLGLIGWSGSLAGHKGSEWVVRRYIEQASSGLLHVHTDYVRQHRAASTVSNQFRDPNSDNSPQGRDEVGVVEESTISRFETYRQGLQIWRGSPRTIAFGVGYGSVGPELQRRFDPGYSEKSLVNNQFIQILVELGLVGMMIVLYILWQFVRLYRRSQTNPAVKLTVVGLLIAMAVQFQFYSALHLPQLWLVLALSVWLLTDGMHTKKAVK